MARPAWSLASTPTEKADAALCVVLFALWQGHLGAWIHAGNSLTLGLVDFRNTEVPEHILRAATQVSAAIFEYRLKRSGPDGFEGWQRERDRLVQNFQALSPFPAAKGLVYSGQIPAKALVLLFLNRVQAWSNAFVHADRA
jgi:hypothetical protein